jgi:hypothetical protein
VIDRAVAGDLGAWTGLPPDETRSSLERALAPVADVSGPVEAERPASRFQVLTFQRERAPRQVEAWFPVGSEHPELLEYDDPVVDDLDALLDALGEPELEQIGKRGADGALVTERVYGSRGLTLSVAAPFEHAVRGEAPPGTRRLIHVQLYPATSAQHWLTDIGAGLPPRPFPPRGGPAAP